MIDIYYQEALITYGNRVIHVAGFHWLVKQRTWRKNEDLMNGQMSWLKEETAADEDDF